MKICTEVPKIFFGPCPGSLSSAHAAQWGCHWGFPDRTQLWHLPPSLLTSLSCACCLCLGSFSSACSPCGASVMTTSFLPRAFASLFPKGQRDVLSRVKSFAQLLLTNVLSRICREFSIDSSHSSHVLLCPFIFNSPSPMMISVTDIHHLLVMLVTSPDTRVQAP